MLRFLGQASKQSSQALAPAALNPRCLTAVAGDPTSRTPRTPSSSFVGLQASPFLGNQDGATTPRTPKTPSCCTAALSTDTSLFKSPFFGAQDVDDESSTQGLLPGFGKTDEPALAELAAMGSDATPRTPSTPSTTAGDGPIQDSAMFCHRDDSCSPVGGMPTLLGRISAHGTRDTPTAQSYDEAYQKQLQADPESVRQAVLARQSRIASRCALNDAGSRHASFSRVLLGHEVQVQAPGKEINAEVRGVIGTVTPPIGIFMVPELAAAHSAREAFLSRMATRSARRLTHRV